VELREAKYTALWRRHTAVRAGSGLLRLQVSIS